ncbi:hypothetical protein CANMA_000758 [Candida margitis]|uniref:uncharacterized protein n=1 Tax=Candida margitis TaxID=1775924 RepID=UPI0022260A90|nr:uncharacterized protein CANMA_000758 [Candida margitis]KAI5970147.1 hypothetical protein CANMA_000758 [Candida margitis]
MIYQSIRLFATSSSPSSFANQNYYQLLELPTNATIKEIKLQFKKLSKKYHPDLNQHLDAEAKQENNSKYVAMVNAYDTLKDIKKKRAYDQSSSTGGGFSSSNSNRRSNEYNKYYGEAKYYSRSGKSTYSASGLNTKRHKVKYQHSGSTGANQSRFSGEHINHGDKYDVPHFDYDKHLNRNLRFEQRIIDKYMDPATRDRILSQLQSSGEHISEELKTKHLLRHVKMIKPGYESGGNGEVPSSGGYGSASAGSAGSAGTNGGPTSSSTGGPNASGYRTNYGAPKYTHNVKYGQSTNYQGAATYQNLYQKPKTSNYGYNSTNDNDDQGGVAKLFTALGAGTSLYILYKIIF